MNNRPRLWHVLVSAFAAAFGVQSKNNLERDFNSNSIWPFIIAGLIFTLVFIAVVATVVKLVLAAH